MSAPPYMKLFWADYHQDTRHLTRDEHGAYFLLLGEAWNRGGYLPDDDALLARLALATPKEWDRLKPVVMAFFRPAPKGRWRHKRIAEELASYDDVSRKRKAAGKKGGSARRGKHAEKSEANAVAIAKQKPTKPEPEPEPESQVVLFPEVGEKAETQQRRVASPTRGSRLKPDWEPSAEDVAYALAQGFAQGDVRRIGEAFRDYWTAATGQKASKADWPATWRNWIRTEAERRGRRADVPARRATWV